MIVELLRTWTTVLGLSVIIWHSGVIARRYGWNIGKKAFFIQYTSVVKSPKSGNYRGQS